MVDGAPSPAGVGWAHDQPPPPHPSRRRARPPRSRPRPPRQVPPPTLAFDRPCYTAEQALAFTGSGYTPSGPVQLLFSVPGEARAAFTGAADAAGGIAGRLGVEEDALLAKDEDRRDLAASPPTRRAPTPALRRSPSSASRSSRSPAGPASPPAATCRGARSRLEAFGWAFAAGKPLYLHFQKGRTTVAAVRAGVAERGTAGDLRGARSDLPRRKLKRPRLRGSSLSTRQRARRRAALHVAPGPRREAGLGPRRGPPGADRRAG